MEKIEVKLEKDNHDFIPGYYFPDDGFASEKKIRHGCLYAWNKQ